MNWPIPDFKKKEMPKLPSGKLWGSILFILSSSGALIAIFLLNAVNYRDIFFNGLLPAVVVGLFFWGIVWLRYEHSSHAVILWDIETQKNKLRWQHWAMWQRPIIASITLCPEEYGVKMLTGHVIDIPAYPLKCRRLHHNLPDLCSKLSFLDINLEQQLPGYRNNLYEIIVLQTDSHDASIVAQAIFRQWDIMPVIQSSADKYFSGAEACSIKGVTLLVTLQDWPGTAEGQYSEFINAKIICDAEKVDNYSPYPKAGVGRVLHSDNLMKSLDVLTEYNKLKSCDIRYVWLSAVEEKDMIELVKYADKHQWKIPPYHPFLSINHSFGPSGPLAFPVAISLLTDAAIQTGEMQLLISGSKEGTYSLCLVTGRLFNDGRRAAS